MHTIEDFKGMAVPVRNVPEKERTKVLNQIDAAIERATLEKSSLLGIEVETGKALDAAINQLEFEKLCLNTATDNKGGVGRLSLEPFGWQDDSGYPLFAIFTPSSAKCILECKVTIRRSWDGGTRYTQAIRFGDSSYPAPTFIKEAFKPGLEALKEESKRWKKTITLTTIFSGIIPAEKRASIGTAIKHFGAKGVFLVTEASWKRTEKNAEVAVPAYRDPLICGWDGTALWLVDSFDMTPIEEYIAKEFTI